jgi:signal transduction histidine kinase
MTKQLQGLVAVVLLLALPWAGRAEERVIGSAAEVLALPASEAGKRIKVHITGVVTAAEPGWNGQFFMQDASAGIFVENLSSNQPAPGDVVDISGETHPGAFAPIISSPVWRKVGTAPLPEARPVTIESLEAGQEDGQRVQVSGIVRRIGFEARWMIIDLVVGRYRLLVYSKDRPMGNPQSLVGARVTVRGTAATDYNIRLRHLTSVAVYVPRSEDFSVEETEPADPFTTPVIRLTDVAQYRRGSKPGHRIHVSGTLVHLRPGEDLFLQDRTGGLRILCADTGGLRVGDPVEAVGFLEFEGYLPLLQDAAVRRGEGETAPAPVPSSSTLEVLNGLHNAELITLRGRILDRSARGFSRKDGQETGLRTTWLVQGEGLGFTMEHEVSAGQPTMEDVPIGSLVEATGVCFSEAGRDGKLKSLVLLLPSASSVRVLQYPSWFTAVRLLAILLTTCVLLSIAIFWSITASRRNRQLRVLMKEREEAREELQQAHDTLEEKVRERTDQLKVEITARKTTELQFKAVLAERTRLARDLHDSLEQTLTGISLQLETSSKLFDQSPDNALHHLQLARNWIRQSQVELHRSIWDLRSRELERFDLASAIDQSARHAFEPTQIRCEFSTIGERRPLPEVVEENILRIAQEAVTNVIKHAQADRVWITLEFSPEQLVLRIRDNGRGGISNQPLTAGDNHFGLLGMSERAKRLTGRFLIDSAPGKGTQILVEVPLEPASPAFVSPPPASPIV